MRSEPLISVVIPTVGRGGLLADALSSVRAQSYENIEIIVVSDDEAYNNVSHETAKRYEAHYFKNDRAKGPAGARNAGILHSSGEFIAFLDDDDTWHPDKIERQIRKFMAETLDMGLVYCWAYYRNMHGRTGKVQVRTNVGELFPSLLAEIMVNGTPTAMVRRSVLEHVGLFDEELRYWEDQELYARIARHYRISCIPEYLVEITVDHEFGRLTDIDKGKIRMSAEALVYITVKYREDFEQNWHLARKMDRRIALEYHRAGERAISREYFRKSIIGRHGLSIPMLLRFCRGIIR